jgi:hypothetical protein
MRREEKKISPSAGLCVTPPDPGSFILARSRSEIRRPDTPPDPGSFSSLGPPSSTFYQPVPRLLGRRAPFLCEVWATRIKQFERGSVEQRGQRPGEPSLLTATPSPRCWCFSSCAAPPVRRPWSSIQLQATREATKSGARCRCAAGGRGGVKKVAAAR